MIVENIAWMIFTHLGGGDGAESTSQVDSGNFVVCDSLAYDKIYIQCQKLHLSSAKRDTYQVILTND